MNNANAIGFFLLGTVMQIVSLTSLADGLGLAEGQALWLQVMSVVTGGIGAGHLVRVGAREFSDAMSRFALRRAEAREQLLQPARQEVPLGVRVTF